MSRIPFFKEIVIMSFDCPHCHFKENEVRSASEIQEKGIRYTLKVDGLKVSSLYLIFVGYNLVKWYDTSMVPLS